MAPWSTFNINGNFTLHKRFFKLEKTFFLEKFTIIKMFLLRTALWNVSQGTQNGSSIPLLRNPPFYKLYFEGCMQQSKSVCADQEPWSTESLCTQSADIHTQHNIFTQITRSSSSKVTVSYKATHESVPAATQKCWCNSTFMLRFTSTRANDGACVSITSQPASGPSQSPLRLPQDWEWTPS